MTFTPPTKGPFAPPPKCSTCGDIGVVSRKNHKGIEFYGKCFCAQGQAIPELYAASDKDKKNPIKLPQAKPEYKPPADFRTKAGGSDS